jgi:hypothetical protein
MESKQSVTPPKENNAKEAARGYIDRGWAVVPVEAGDKQTFIKDWPNLRISESEVGEWFTEDSSVGIILGDVSNGLTDVEADCDEAVYAASRLLPETLRMGRGSITGHYEYVSPGSKNQKFKDVDGSTVLLEIRSTGSQTVFPPSSHESGERRVFRNPETEPLEIEAGELRSAAGRVAVSALIARHLSEKGRHDTALAYAGYVLKNLMDLGEDQDNATVYVWNLLDPAWECNDADEEGRNDLYAAIEGTASKLYAGEEQITGAGYLRDNLEHGAAIVKKIKEWLGWELSDEQREAIEQRQRVKRAEKAIAEPAVSTLAKNPNLLKALYDRVAESGLLGERENAEILLLAAVALTCGKPISAIIKGTSAVGKSEIIKAVTRALPPEMVVERQSMSSQSLVYMGENGQLKNKVLVVYELGGFGAEGSEGLEQAKQLLSEGRISRQTVDRDESNRNTGRAIVTEGPTAMWTTTTKVKTDYELSTRVFELTPDDGQEQTGRINEKAFDYEEAEEVDFSDTHGIFTWLLGQDNRVYFPYGKALGKMIPKSAVKMRRESPRFRVLLDAHAVLHQASRKRDERGRIVATPEDYEAVKRLMDPFVGTASEQGVKEQVRVTVEAAAEIVADSEGKSFTVKKLQAALKKDNGSTNRRIRAAHPYIVELDEKRGRSKLYGLGDELPLKVDALPSRDELCKSATESSPRGEGGSGTKNGAERSAEFGADFAQSSAGNRAPQTRKPPFNGESGGGEAHEEVTTGRGSIGVQSCRVRGGGPADTPNSVQTSPNSADRVAEFVRSLPPEFLPPQSDVDELRESYGPDYVIRTPQELMSIYLRDGYAKPKFRIRGGQRVLVGLAASR